MPMNDPVLLVGLWGVPSDIPDMVVSPVPVIVASIHSFRPRPNESFQNNRMDAHPFVAMPFGAKRDVLIAVVAYWSDDLWLVVSSGVNFPHVFRRNTQSPDSSVI